MTGMLHVDTEAVAANTRRLAALGERGLIAVVKADGYGHGAVALAHLALSNGATSVGVTDLREALALRSAGITAPLLSWLNGPDSDYSGAVDECVDVALTDLDQLRAVRRGVRDTRAKLPARVHLYIDCGMARDGAAPTTWDDLCRGARQAVAAGEVQVVGLMGHLGCSEDAGDPCNAQARTTFEAARAAVRAAGLCPTTVHLGGTPTALNLPWARRATLRLGAGLVGLDLTRSGLLRPALTLCAALTSVREVRAGTGVGYGHTWRAPRRTRLGLIPLGYADGLPRSAGERARVLVNGAQHPVVGRISMDQIVVDLGTTPALPGDRAVIFGPGTVGEPTVADWARWAGTLDHEIVTGLGHRLTRHYVPRSDRCTT